MRSEWIRPDWPAPASVGAAMSTRAGGVSSGPWASLNLRPPELDDLEPAAAKADTLDDPATRHENLRRWQEALGAEPVILRQVHGHRVVVLDGPSTPGQHAADAAVTTQRGLACTVLVADCLPVLMCDRQGLAVAAAHAGWRGLASGVLEHTVAALCQAAECEPGDLLAWLGPCIGADAFEVGADVLKAFAGDASGHARFKPASRPDGSLRWRADLAGLAADRMSAAGVGSLHRLAACTVSEPSRFFSFRRDGLTGRMAASIWRR